VLVATPQYNTRGSQEVARLQDNDVTLFVPVILIRGEKLDVVPYLGLLDKDDGALGVEIQARICRMKQRFKEFEGHVFCNTQVSVLPRMQVFKCMVLTNGMYAAEVWNYTRADMDRFEKHYFRLLRSTLFMLKYDTTYLAVLNSARAQGVIKIHPIENYVQRQQLKFLWKVLHLEDTALQRIVLHGKLDPQYSQGRGGRKRTYKHCIQDALANFGVTMVQCRAMAQQEWDAVIEGTGMETADQRWEARPKASKPIDIEWRIRPEHGPGRRNAHTPLEATVGEDEADIGTAEDSDESSDSESVPTDEVEQSPVRQERNDGVAVKEEVILWDEDTGTGARDVRTDEHRHGTRSHGTYVRRQGTIRTGSRWHRRTKQRRPDVTVIRSWKNQWMQRKQF
jgi:hypothetical protein